MCLKSSHSHFINWGSSLFKANHNVKELILKTFVEFMYFTSHLDIFN